MCVCVCICLCVVYPVSLFRTSSGLIRGTDSSFRVGSWFIVAGGENGRKAVKAVKFMGQVYGVQKVTENYLDYIWIIYG